MDKKADIQKLVGLVARLRGPDGCPWDREQTPETLKPMLIEEAYEVIEAIDSKDPDQLCAELGDLLFQVVFHSQIASERGHFTLAEVIDRTYEKMYKRHPHVFGGADYKTSAEVLRNWEDIKAVERGEEAPRPLLSGIPSRLPPLYQAYQLTAKAARVGFDWSTVEQIVEKLREEAEELLRAVRDGQTERIADEVGDLLFVAANIARFLEIDPESALRRANLKFVERFNYIEEEMRRRGKTLKESSLEEMDQLWEEAKIKLGG